MSIKSVVVTSFEELWSSAEADEKAAVAALVAAEHNLVERTPWYVLAIDGSLIFALGVAVGYFI